jgi:hypothetical protein
LDFARPTIALLTNVIWDAQLHYRSNAFPSMLDWVLETVRYFTGRPQLNLVIRIHPAELTGSIPSRQPIAAELARRFPVLPANVRVAGPDSRICTYALAEMSNAVLIYNTKTGIELASIGLPVIVAGEAWIRGKGFSFDASSPEQYRALLDALPFPRRLAEDHTRLALKYAYHFFFRRMIPLPFVRHLPPEFDFRLMLSSFEQLAAERHAGLEVICNGILSGSDFVFPAESQPWFAL